MTKMKKMPKIALGAWAWGNDGTFGGNLTSEALKPVFDTAMKEGLNLWDTAYAYGMGTSEKVLGEFLATVPRDSYLISDKFTPQCADPSAENAVTALYEKSAELLGTDYMDFSGKYDTEHPFPEDSDRGRTYNPMLSKLEKLNKGLEEIADRHHVATAQIPVPWAIAKGTLPIIGVTKVYQVEDAVKAVAVELSTEEIETIEKLGNEAQVNVIRYWEKEMK